VPWKAICRARPRFGFDAGTYGREGTESKYFKKSETAENGPTLFSARSTVNGRASVNRKGGRIPPSEATIMGDAERRGWGLIAREHQKSSHFSPTNRVKIVQIPCQSAIPLRKRRKLWQGIPATQRKGRELSKSCGSRLYSLPGNELRVGKKVPQSGGKHFSGRRLKPRTSHRKCCEEGKGLRHVKVPDFDPPTR